MNIKNYLQEALKLAQKARGFCAPNPAVGAVVVKDNQIIAYGYHHGYGQPHAEVNALRQLSNEQCHKATLYVTLEPCSHQGKTPPCTTLIQQKGIRHVIYGYPDLNPATANRSQTILQQVGVTCDCVAIPAIDDFYRSYRYWWQTGLPALTAKLALSLDGKIAGTNGQPIAITSSAANQYTHQQRYHSDAILTTVQTILADDPRLNARLASQTITKPIYVLDRQLKLPLTAKIWYTADSITLFYDENNKQQQAEKLQNLQQAGARCIPVSTEHEHRLSLWEALSFIGSQGVQDLWVEAGGCLIQALIEKHWLHQLLLYIAPIVLGPQAKSAFMSRFYLQARGIQWHGLGPDGLCQIQW